MKCKKFTKIGISFNLIGFHFIKLRLSLRLRLSYVKSDIRSNVNHWKNNKDCLITLLHIS